MSLTAAPVLRLVAGAALLMAAAFAFARASLVDAEPADGVVHEAAPLTVRLRFNEAVSPIRMAC